MTFLNPLVLFGLIAGAIPVILHLLNLRKLRTIEFSTLAFLKELQQTKIRKLKFRQLLLLLLRTLAILCLVLAFARPALRGPLFGKLGGTAHSTVVLIFDDSFSMTASDQYGGLFKQAKEKTERLIDLLNDGDEVYLLKLSDLPAGTVDPATHDLPGLRRMIRESAISMVTRPITDALNLSSKLLARSKNANKEVYIISDMQETLFPPVQPGDTAGANAGGNYFLVEIGAKPVDNATVDSIEIVSRIFETGKPVQIRAIVRNYSETPVMNSALSAFLDNSRAGQATLRIDPWGTATVTMNITPKHSGIVRGYAELENDAIEQDNRRYFSFTIPQHINVAVVADNPQDAKFPILALRAGDADSARSLIAVQQVSSQKFPLIDLKSIDVVLLMNAKGLTQSGLENLRDYVRRGGGVMIMPAADARPAELNSSLLPMLDISPIKAIIGNPKSGASFSFQKIDLDHPLFSSIFENTGTTKPEGIESPQILMAIQQVVGRNGHEIITMTGGEPFLTEYQYGEGKILFYSVSPSLTWSDFPVKGIFVPLVHRSVVYLAVGEQGSQAAITGQDALIVVPPAAGAGGTQYTLFAPDGTQEYILPVSMMGERALADRQGAAALRTAATATPPGMLGFLKTRIPLPGYYDLKQGAALRAVLSANVDGKESDTRKASEKTLNELWRRRGIEPRVIPSPEQAAQLQAAVLQSRFGVELWKYFLGAALLLALIEMLVARDARNQEQQG